MAKTKEKISSDALADFDAEAFTRKFEEWFNSGGREELDGAVETVRRDVMRLKRSLEVRPEMLSEAVTF